MKRFLFILLFSAIFMEGLRAQFRWDISGPHAVTWSRQRGGVPHGDHVEMSGRNISVVYYWSVGLDGAFSVDRHLVFPSLRTIPDNTHASWMPRTDVSFTKDITFNGSRAGEESVKEIKIDGMLHVTSALSVRGKSYELHRQFSPSPAVSAECEEYTLINTSDEEVSVRIPSLYLVQATDRRNGVTGSYRLVSRTDFDEEMNVRLKPGESVSFRCHIQGFAAREEQEQKIDVAGEFARRRALIQEWTENLVFQCPNDTLNTLFSLSKIRGAESIFDTPSGPMHSPGGESYYAAMWCNDQAEYMNPFFPFLGYELGNESAMTTWDCYLRLLNPAYKFLPWSIICGGRDVYGPFDRGDAAMLAYGAGRYCLERGEKEIASHVWPLIEWCLEYCRRRINAQGVVASEGDELEHRLPSGDANLCTSSLYYDALLSASYLCRQMGKPYKEYLAQAEVLKKNIDAHFSAQIEGYDTYRYYEGNDRLRSWICIPLTMGIFQRAQGTVQAMFSPQLWTENGMLSVSGDKVFWDRSTLYGLRGTFAAGYPDIALHYMVKFSGKRLLGDHVPYVVEAWPEGGQRHLSAENGLYCRVITEGLFGFRPSGFRSFILCPQMPKGWNEYSLRNIHACAERPYSIHVARQKGDRIRITVLTGEGQKMVKNVKAGTSVNIQL